MERNGDATGRAGNLWDVVGEPSDGGGDSRKEEVNDFSLVRKEVFLSAKEAPQVYMLLERQDADIEFYIGGVEDGLLKGEYGPLTGGERCQDRFVVGQLTGIANDVRDILGQLWQRVLLCPWRGTVRRRDATVEFDRIREVFRSLIGEAAYKWRVG